MKNICHITLYPEEGKLYTKKSGVSSYAKNLISAMPDVGENKHIILADRDGSSEKYEEDSNSIQRVWDKGLICIPQIITKVIQIRPTAIHLQHEMSLFGLIGGYMLVILLRIYTWILGSKFIITSHSVVAKNEVTRKFLDDNNQKRPVWFARFGFQILYRILCKADTLIVHEDIFKIRLSQEYNLDTKKVVVIPHGIDSFHRIASNQGREKVKQLTGKDFGTKKILFTMGYVAGYKDIELLIRGFAQYCKNHNDWFLVLGAGIHPKLSGDNQYMEKYHGYESLAKDLIPSDNYSRIGFVADEDIESYYSASDLTIYPYKVALASSGPMAISIGYHTPFVASECFSPYFEQYPELIFSSSIEGISDVLSKDLYSIQSTIDTLYNERVWKKVSERTSELYG